MSGLKVTKVSTFRYQFTGIARGPNYMRATVQGSKFRQLLVQYFAVEKQYLRVRAQRINTSPSGPYGQGHSYRDLEEREYGLRGAMESLIIEMKNHRGFMQQPDIVLRSAILPNGFYIRIAKGRAYSLCEKDELVRGHEILQRRTSEDLRGNTYRLVAIDESKKD